MRKIRLFLLLFLLSLTLGWFPNLRAEAAGKEVYLGGMPAGFLLNLNGAQIVGFCGVVTKEGTKQPSEEAGLRVGDVILSLERERIRSVKDLETVLSDCDDSEIGVTYRRGKEECHTEVLPVREEKTDRYKLGILVRDTVSGIGTVTCIEKDSGRFGALGHAVTDEAGERLKVANGKIYPCSIVDVQKGERGRAGELKGIFLNLTTMGMAQENRDTGIFGTFDSGTNLKLPTMRTAALSETKMGAAEIYTTVDGVTPKAYRISIVKVDKSNKENKNFVIKISDEALLEATGGIVQGMSGSPIVQNGKLIGAVTHVFLNDPTRGYGIGIEQMFGE